MMTETALKYGDSFYDLAMEEGQTKEVLEQFTMVVNLFKENPEYHRLLAEPSIPKAVRVKLLDEAFGGKVWPYLLNFLKLMCEHGNLGELNGALKEFKKRFNADNGIAEAIVTSARELSEDQKKSLLEKLEKMSGKKVDMTVLVNPALIGGIRLDYEGKRYDGTAKHRLDELARIVEQA